MDDHVSNFYIYLSRNTDFKKSMKVNFQWLQQKVVTRKFKDGVVCWILFYICLSDRLIVFYLL